MNSTRACSDCLALAELARLVEPKCLQLFLERLSEKCARDNPERQYGICSIHCSWHCSCRTYFCCFPLALADICTLPLLPFFQISLKNSELKTTHSTFRGCRVHFIRQPFSKHNVAVYGEKLAWQPVWSYQWKMGDPAKTVTFLLAEPTLCFSSKRLTKSCKKMLEKLARSPRGARAGESPLYQGDMFSPINGA